MRYQNKLQYVISAFWNGDGMSVDDVEGRVTAIKRATKDLMPRTLKRIMPETEDFNGAVIEALLPRINEWFHLPENAISEDSFDKWHSKACANVLRVLQKFYINQDGTPVAYGKAQKIVNMTMKGIRCLDGAAEKECYFQHCHMALDSFILEWFCRQVMPWHNEAKKTKDKLKKQAIVSWSIIPEGNGVQPYGYNTYVGYIRRYFKATRPYEGLTPLQAEFFIWTEIQLELAAESLYGQSIEKEAAVADAMQKWSIQWTDAQKNDINKQFDRCKKEFKLRPLEEKVVFLRNRVKQLCRYCETK